MPETYWLRGAIVADLRLRERSDCSTTTANVAEDIGYNISAVNAELRQMRAEGMVACSQVRSGASSRWTLLRSERRP